MGYLIQNELNKLSKNLNIFVNLEIYIAKRTIDFITIPENFKWLYNFSQPKEEVKE